VGDVQKKRVHGDHFIFWGKVISVLSVKPLNPSGPSGQIHVFGRLDQYYVLCKVTLGALKGASKLNVLFIVINTENRGSTQMTTVILKEGDSRCLD
jgi:hypothetical protein